MAKVGFWLRGTRGKLAGASFSKGENGQTIARQIVTPSNPQTYAQAAQRAKIVPASGFYRAFRSILNHAFLPDEPDRKNRRKFMKYALSRDMEMPLEIKGSTRLATNVPYVISRGGLGLDYLTQAIAFTANSAVKPRLFAFTNIRQNGDSGLDELSIGSLTEEFLQSDNRLEEGMEFTFMFLKVTGLLEDDYQVIPCYCSFVLNRLDTRLLSELLPSGISLGWTQPNWIPGMSDASTDGCLTFQTTEEAEAEEAQDWTYMIGAVGLIISSKTESSWVYTNSQMNVDPHAAFGNRLTVIQSYMKPESANSSDLTLQQANNVQEQATPAPYPVAIESRAFTLREGWTQPDSNTVAVLRYSDGSIKLLGDGNTDRVVYQPANVDGNQLKVLSALYNDLRVGVPVDYLTTVEGIGEPDGSYANARDLGGYSVSPYNDQEGGGDRP